MQSKANLGVIILNVSLKLHDHITSKVNALENRRRGSLLLTDDPALVRVHSEGGRGRQTPLLL